MAWVDISAGETGGSARGKINGLGSDVNSTSQESLVIVKVAADLSGSLDSTKVYVIDGVIDFTGTGLNIEVPQGDLQ
jgi:hypothetical protein